MNPRSNELLDQLPELEYETMKKSLQLISLVEGTELYRPGDRLGKVIFPVVDTLIAIGTLLKEGHAIDNATIGADGLIGLISLDDITSSHRIYVAKTGLAYTIERNELLSAAHHQPKVLSMCVQAGIILIRKISIELACTNFHSIEQRLAKWILTRHRQSGIGTVRASHQSIADSLGTRREAITNTLPKLFGISYSRCQISVEDYEKLKLCSCSCYLAQRNVHPF